MKPEIKDILNKIDMISDQHVLHDAEAENPGCVFVSAHRGLNLLKLLETMQTTYEESSILRTLNVPYDRMHVLNRLYEDVEVLHRTDHEAGIELSVRIPSEKLNAFTARYTQYIASDFQHQ